MKRTIFQLYYALCIFFILNAPSKAAECIGYYTNSAQIGVMSQWGDKGDQFSNVNIVGNVSWPLSRGTAMYYSPNGVKGEGIWSTYSISLPKTIDINGVKLDVTIPGHDYLNFGNHPTKNIWILTSKNESCYAYPQWSLVDNVKIRPEIFNINIQGKALPSGTYNVTMPYVIAWALDRWKSPQERTKSIWPHIPANTQTGEFNISFTVTNKCSLLSSQNIHFDYGSLPVDLVNGSTKEVNRQIKCLTPTNVTFSLLPATVNLNNGVTANIKVKKDNVEQNTILVDGNTSFLVESVLQANGNIKTGAFSGSSVLNITYP